MARVATSHLTVDGFVMNVKKAMDLAQMINWPLLNPEQQHLKVIDMS
jgi:hypothetical protein